MSFLSNNVQLLQIRASWFFIAREYGSVWELVCKQTLLTPVDKYVWTFQPTCVNHIQ